MQAGINLVSEENHNKSGQKKARLDGLALLLLMKIELKS